MKFHRMSLVRTDEVFGRGFPFGDKLPGSRSTRFNRWQNIRVPTEHNYVPASPILVIRLVVLSVSPIQIIWLLLHWKLSQHSQASFFFWKMNLLPARSGVSVGRKKAPAHTWAVLFFFCKIQILSLSLALSLFSHLNLNSKWERALSSYIYTSRFEYE